MVTPADAVEDVGSVDVLDNRLSMVWIELSREEEGSGLEEEESGEEFLVLATGFVDPATFP